MIYAEFASREDIDTVIYDDELYDRLSTDDSPPKEEFKVPYDGGYFIGGYVNGEIASLYIVHDDIEKMHFMVLKKFRKHSRDLLKVSMGYWPHRVYCIIPDLYKSVINFAKKAGFKEVGMNKGTFKKNNKVYDEYILEYEV